MEALRLVVSTAVLLLLCCSAVTAAPETPATPSGGGASQAMPCIQKLMPCQPYLHAPNPPVSCCLPLKEMLSTDMTCLCSVFNNPDILRSLNLTKSNALDLPKACGANVDVSLCKSSASSPTASPVPKAPTTPPPATANGSTSTEGPPKSAAATISFVGLNFVFAFIATIFL